MPELTTGYGDFSPYQAPIINPEQEATPANVRPSEDAKPKNTLMTLRKRVLIKAYEALENVLSQKPISEAVIEQISIAIQVIENNIHEFSNHSHRTP